MEYRVETVKRLARATYVCMAVVQAKVGEGGLGLWPVLYASSVCDAQYHCSHSMQLVVPYKCYAFAFC